MKLFVRFIVQKSIKLAESRCQLPFVSVTAFTKIKPARWRPEINRFYDRWSRRTAVRVGRPLSPAPPTKIWAHGSLWCHKCGARSGGTKTDSGRIGCRFFSDHLATAVSQLCCRAGGGGGRRWQRAVAVRKSRNWTIRPVYPRATTP